VQKEIAMASRIVLADSQSWVRIGIREVLHAMPNVTICGESSDGRDALKQCKTLNPDIVITDSWLPGASASILTRRLREYNPKQKVLVFGLVDSDLMIRDLLRAGVKAVVLKTDPASDLVYAVEALLQDQPYFTPTVQRAIVSGYLREEHHDVRAESHGDLLSFRELEILQLLVEGRQSKEIAAMLGISFRTAATHRSNLMRKLDVHNIAQLTLYAVAHGQLRVPRFSMPAVLKMNKPELERKIAKAAA
jgi:DNA-binding NarL/FixJ family response regulator